jgi:hypothetical protein
MPYHVHDIGAGGRGDGCDRSLPRLALDSPQPDLDQFMRTQRVLDGGHDRRGQAMLAEQHGGFQCVSPNAQGTARGRFEHADFLGQMSRRVS